MGVSFSQVLLISAFLNVKQITRFRQVSTYWNQFIKFNRVRLFRNQTILLSDNDSRNKFFSSTKYVILNYLYFNDNIRWSKETRWLLRHFKKTKCIKLNLLGTTNNSTYFVGFKFKWLYICPSFDKYINLEIGIPGKLFQTELFDQCIIIEPYTKINLTFRWLQHRAVIIIMITYNELNSYKIQIKYLLNSIEIQKQESFTTMKSILIMCGYKKDFNIKQKILFLNLDYYCFMDIKTKKIYLNDNSRMPYILWCYLNNIKTINKAKNIYK